VKPAYCWLCGRDFRWEWFHTRGGGELVQFRDYEPLPEGCVGQPRGLEWFCRDHAPEARALAALDSHEALRELRGRHGLFPAPEISPVRDPSLWLTSVGAQRARVLAVIQRATGHNAAQALALLQSAPSEVARGWPGELERWQTALQSAGAGAEIHYD
jgi:hypothetical protein